MPEGQNTNQNTPPSQDSGADSDKSAKLVFGKYKSLEEAEKAHKELERKFHEGNERYVQLDSRLQQIESRNYDTDEGYRRGQAVQQQPDAGEDTQLLTRFYASPKAVLSELEERAVAKAEQRISQKQQRNADYQQRVTGWANEHQDVAKYGDLLTYYVGQTDARLTPETRLDQAAEMVRKRVFELRGTPQQQELDPASYVDGATSTHGETQRAVQQVTPSSNESELKGYVAKRNATARKPLQHGGTAAK